MEAQMQKTQTALELSRIFDAPVSRLYQAWIDPKMMNAWFKPNEQLQSTCTVDLRVGGAYEVRMQPPEGDPYVALGVYKEIIPDEKLAFTWRWAHESPDQDTLVTILFRPVGDSASELTLLHSRFPNVEERDKHSEGWLGTFEQLAIALG